MPQTLDASADTLQKEPALSYEDPQPYEPRQSSWAKDVAALEFSRFVVLLRRRQVLVDGVPAKLGSRAFDLLLVLLEADGSLVTKDELISRVWSGVFVAEENLKTQINAWRKVLGEDRDCVRTEFGRGYRFTATIRRTVAPHACKRTVPRRMACS